MMLGRVPTCPLSTTDTLDVERLFNEHNTALLRFIAAKIGSMEEAEEVVQEAYVRLLQLDCPSTVSFLQAFLFKTASNLAIDRLRQRGRRSNVISLPEVDFAVFNLTPDRQLSGEQAITIVNAAVTRLPPKCREAFLLHRVHEMHVEEIAKRMGIGVCMVRRYIARGLEYVRQCLDTAGHPDLTTPP